jgi:hypothetical protein
LKGPQLAFATAPINEELLMLKQTKTIHQSVVDGKSVRRFEVLSRELRPVEMDNVVPFQRRFHSRAGQLRVLSLAELKAENAALRNLAVELSLEIRALCDGNGDHKHSDISSLLGSSGLDAVTSHVVPIVRKAWEAIIARQETGH